MNPYKGIPIHIPQMHFKKLFEEEAKNYKK